jgi:protein-S-isoprenylcysteine O-methyltransferase Ste14
MPPAVRHTLILIGLTFFPVAIYHRLRAARSGEKIDRTKEGWPILIGLRLAGLATLGTTVAWLWNPARFTWAAVPMPEWARWIGVVGFAFAVGLLIWMLVSLGPNLTDTVVTRKDAYFVERGPYLFVRNPMYSAILLLGPSLGLALGTWLLPIAATAMFGILARRTRIEEGYLIARFGDRYRDYMTRVGRFFPRLHGS